MLHDAIERADRVVDQEAALEFMKEATKLASAAQLQTIGDRLEAKAGKIQSLLHSDRIDALEEDRFRELLGWMFTLRRKAGRLIRHNGIDRLRSELRALLYGGEKSLQRLDRFVKHVGGLEKSVILSLATESLHFVDPQRYWLWTHWIWNPNAKTGALALVTQQEVLLDGATDGEVYAKVGEAMRRVNAQGHVVGFTRLGRGLFGTDVFLACVYAVYMYTVFRVKLSQEFNRILPELPEFVERVLGVHRKAGDNE